jgi:pimeloyl-ACP methyl ester carboxylesterase
LKLTSEGCDIYTAGADFWQPDDGRQLAQLIPGSRFQLMENLGHFPMTENPDASRA